MTHRLHHDCAHDCEGCHLADPDLCPDYAHMTADDHAVRWCKHCSEPAWHDEHTFTEGSGAETKTDVWFCPRCRRVFG
jgi:hypothetical protein